MFTCTLQDDVIHSTDFLVCSLQQKHQEFAWN